ncbi:hypothetical protein B0H13DRAFT_1874482 [Mycena leptocephala]|nr:hypothetical protein B0H13DRAFT_1874482 [Mycena leptocephala]
MYGFQRHGTFEIRSRFSSSSFQVQAMKARLEGRPKNSQMEPLNSSSLRGGSETKPKTLTGFGIGIYFRWIFFGIFGGRFGFTARCRACTKMRADKMRRDEMKSGNRKPEVSIDRGTYSPAYEGRNQKKQQREEFRIGRCDLETCTRRHEEQKGSRNPEVGAVRRGGDLYHVHVVPLVRLSSESEIGGVGLGGEGSCAGVKEEVGKAMLDVGYWMERWIWAEVVDGKDEIYKYEDQIHRKCVPKLKGPSPGLEKDFCN